MRILFVFALLLASVLAGQRRYDGYQVFEVKARDKAAFNAMVQMFESGNYDFWKEPSGLDDTMDVMVPPAFNEAFVNVLKAFGMHYRIKIADVQTRIDESKKDIASPIGQPRSIRHGRNAPRYALTWDAYYDLPAIYEFINETARAYPNLVKVRSGGLSYEGRDMPIVTISSGGTGKNAIFVDGGIHAREWISPAFTTWLIHELVENYTAHPEFVDKLDWHIMPTVNPDGYAWTHNPNGDRLWRKNRAPNPVIDRCIGVDLNRNFDFHYDEGGSSEIGCTQNVNGAGPFSEVESRNIRDAVLSVAAQTKAYLTFHSYGQYFLYPWGYTTELPADWQELDRLAKSATNALTALYGTTYTVGSTTNVLYVASGGSDDWVKGVAKINYSYVAEMRDTGTNGFTLPAEQIIPNNLEMWESVKVIARNFMSP